MELQPSLILAVVAGVALAAAAGLRAFLPLLAVGLAGRFLHLPLASGVQWLQSDLALIGLGVATVLEIAGDKIPAVDHALDLAGTVVRPVAAWVASYAVLEQLPPPLAAALALVLGGGALAVHAVKAKTRVGSTALTLGAGNPVLSFLEDGTALGIVLAAILAPLIALVGIVVLIAIAVALLRRRRAPRAPVASA